MLANKEVTLILCLEETKKTYYILIIKDVKIF